MGLWPQSLLVVFIHYSTSCVLGLNSLGLYWASLHGLGRAAFGQRWHLGRMPRCRCWALGDGSYPINVFIQKITRGPSATVFTVATASVTSQSPTMFGLVTVADDKMTEGPEFDSAEIGRVQGLSAFSDMKAPATLEVPNFLFTAGKYNGSSISFLGRHEIVGSELPMVGGTGVFRFARGYAVMTYTYPDGYAADRAVLEYWIHVITSNE